jgi:hypothetical protein
MTAPTTPPLDTAQHQLAEGKASSARMLRWPFLFSDQAQIEVT